MPVGTKPFLGWLVLKKTGGDGPYSGQVQIPFTRIAPYNPINQSYEGAVNASSFPSIKTDGIRTPSFAVETFLIPAYDGTGWSEADLINSLVNVYGTDAQTDKFSAFFKDNRSSGAFGGGVRRYDHSYCNQINFHFSQSGGPVRVEMMFVTRWGDGAGLDYYTTTNPVSGEVYGAAPTYSAPSAPVMGQGTAPHQWYFSSLQGVRSASLTLIRGQAPDKVADGTPYIQEYSSTMFSGTLTVAQNPNGSNYPSGVGTDSISMLGAGGSTSFGRGGIIMNLAYDTNNNGYAHSIEMGNLVSTVSLIDLANGGNPVAIYDIGD